MALNSLDVQNKTFNPQFRGFSKHEVDEFLDIVVRDYDEFAQTIKDQKRELKALRERVKYFDDMKYEEISEVLGTTVGALKASFHIAVKKIEAILINQD